jgi:maleylacetoacetate isomerase
MKLYNFHVSSTSYRTRIVLELKGIPYEYVPVALDKGEQNGPEFSAVNPMHGVPVLEVGGVRIANSPAIIEYLEEVHPHPALLPSDPLSRAHVRTLCAIVACDMHPVNNLRIRNYLRDEYRQDPDGVKRWILLWSKQGFDAIETMLSHTLGRAGFSFGEGPTIADAYLVAQAFASVRFGFDLGPYPLIREVIDTCNALPAFQAAHPSRQPDAKG